MRIWVTNGAWACACAWGGSLLNLTTAEPIYFERGNLICLKFSAERTLLFDLTSGERIRAEA